MIEYHSQDETKVLFESIDGTVTRKLSAAYAADCKALCKEIAKKLLPGEYTERTLQGFAERLVTPGKLKREYRKIYKAARLCQDALANEKNDETPF